MTDYFEIIIIEIPKVVKAYHKTPDDAVLQWMLFLDNPEKEEVIAPIYEAALSMKPDYDVEKIYELLEKNKKLA